MVSSFITCPFLVFALLCSQISFGAIVHQNLDGLPLNVKYDFIVAGGGAGGTLLASRLAENPNWKILLVEAGGPNTELDIIPVPGLWVTLETSSIDWNYTTVPQVALDDRVLVYPRAKVLGGCTSHNSMLYTRGSKGEWDQYAKISGNEGLSWDNILPFLKKAERFVPDLQNHSDAGHYDPAFHGTTGELFTQSTYSDHPFNDMIIQSSRELSQEFPFNLDWNDGGLIGTGWNQYTVDPNFDRSSGVTAFLSHTRNNVHILLNTQVTRVIPTRRNSTEFRVVEVGSDPNSKTRRIVAEKEVIVAGGVFGTPHILLHSGIGNREELEVAGVETLVQNPSVGRNLTDHVAVLMAFSTNMPKTSFDQDVALEEWKTTRTGPLTRPFEMDHLSFVRLPKDAPPFKKEGFHDPSPAEDSAHIEFSYRTVSDPDTNSTQSNPALQVNIAILHPVSRGSVTIQNPDPFIYPSIDVRFLTEEADVSILREGCRTARRLFSAPAFEGSVFGSVIPPENVTSDQDLEDFLRNGVRSFLHGAGTASMSPKNASWGVVDPDFRVKGTTGLRIVDASILPFLPSGHPQAVVYGFAERASIMISRDHM